MRLALTAMLAALALVAAGCGGSSSNDAAEADTTTVETTVDTTATTDDTTSTDDGSTTETVADDTTSADSGEISNIFGSEDCTELAMVGSKLAEAMGAASGNTADLESTQTYFDELAKNAPEEIRGDFATLAEAWAIIVDVYGDLDLKPGETPTADQIQKLSEKGQELSEKLDDAKFEEASSNISAWAEKNCTVKP